nr:outer membrane protein [Kaistia adipata]
MNHLLRTATMASVIALGAATAQAADLTYEPVPAAPEVFNWTGFYVGVHAGIGGGNFDTSFREYEYEEGPADFAFSGYGYDFSDNAFGAFGGAQIGYNYQFATNWVVGAEADIAASGIKAEHNETYSDGWFENNEAKIDWFGTLRGRLGYAWDNVLFYGTGGAAYGKVKLSGSYGYNDDDTWGSFSESDTKWGWTIGAGVEYGITKNITLKTEYLYVDLGSVTANNADFNWDYDNGDVSVDTAFHTLKVGLNYKF